MRTLLIILIITPILAFSQASCPYLDSYKTQNNKHRFNSIGEEGDKIIQIDSLSYFSFSGTHLFLLDSNKCEPYTGKVTNGYSFSNIVNGREIGMSKSYSKKHKLSNLKYITDNLYLIRSLKYNLIQYTDSEMLINTFISLFYYKNKKIIMKYSSYYSVNDISKKEKITFKNKKELENYFLDNKYYQLLKSLYFFDEFPTEVYLDEE